MAQTDIDKVQTWLEQQGLSVEQGRAQPEPDSFLRGLWGKFNRHSRRRCTTTKLGPRLTSRHR